MKRRLVPRAAPPIRASGDRWLFGYADVVTLLFACFASLYAAEVAQGARSRTPPGIPLPIEAPVPAHPASDLPALPPDYLSAVVTATARAGVDVMATERGIVISLPEAGSFAPGRADLTAEVRVALGPLAELLRSMPHAVRVEGHTDDVPIKTAVYASNWELSTARATRVVEWLIEEGGVAATRLSAAGYGEYRPVVPNDGLLSRARNRRVDIVVLDRLAAQDEAPAGAAR